MMNVLVRGPLMNSSGYGVHSRQIFSYLKNKNINLTSQVTPWGICPFYINADYEDGLIGEIIETSKSPHDAFDISFQVQLPSEWDTQAAKTNIGITAGVETDKCSKEWIDAVNSMDLVIVPSNHTKKTFENSGKITTPIHVIPEYIQPGILERKNEPANLNLSTSFNFLMFGLITGQSPETDRKNTFYGVKWLCETFKDDPEVGVIIKTSLGRMSAIDREDTVAVLRKLLKEVRQGPYPKFYLSHGLMTVEELSSFYRSSDIQALVSFTRGEGYGLPLLEACSSGMPVMVTKWSGHMDFMNNVKFSGFEYDLVDVHPDRIDNSIFISGSKWAHPKEEDTKKRLAKIKESYKVPKKWAKDAATYVNKNLDQKSVLKKYEEVLGDFFN